MVSQQQYYTHGPRQFYHQTPQQHGGGDNFHLTDGLETTLQNALQYDTTSHTNNGNFGGVLASKHGVITPFLKSWNIIVDRVNYWRECQLLVGVAFKNSRGTICFHEL
jgi:hypothetical protein